MCLALITHQTLADWPLFIAANRDEEYDRPGSPPEIWSHGPTRVLSPTDLRAGGTWIGANNHGLAVLITNRTDVANGPSAGRSRGILVRELLAVGSLERALACYETLRNEPWAAFNLIVADTRKLQGAAHSGSETAPPLTALAAGTHVISSQGAIGAPGLGEVERAREFWGDGGDDPWGRAAELLALGGSAEIPPIFNSGIDRGTVSSSILGTGRDRNNRGNTRFGFRLRHDPDYQWWAL